MTRSHAIPVLVTLLLTPACRDRPAEVVFPPGGIPIADSTQIVERQWRTWLLEPAWALGGASDRDTTFVEPYLLAPAADRLIVVEADQRVIALGPDGRRLWEFGGQGAGPREFRQIRDVKIGSGGRIYVNDTGNRRITVLTPAGKLERIITLRDVPHSERIVPLTDPTRVALLPLPSSSPMDIAVVSAAGATVRQDSLPWPAYRELSDFGRQLVTATDAQESGRWVLALTFGNGWFTLDDSGPRSARRFFIEPTEFPSYVEEVYPDGSIGRRMVWTEPAALGVWLVGDTVFFRFGGKGPHAGRQVDLYAWGTGNYRYSVPLPEDAEIAAISPGWLYLAGPEPAPWIRAYRRREAADSTAAHAATAAPQEPQKRPPVSSAPPQTAHVAASWRPRPQLEQ